MPSTQSSSALAQHTAFLTDTLLDYSVAAVCACDSAMWRYIDSMPESSHLFTRWAHKGLVTATKLTPARAFLSFEKPNSASNTADSFEEIQSTLSVVGSVDDNAVDTFSEAVAPSEASVMERAVQGAEVVALRLVSVSGPWGEAVMDHLAQHYNIIGDKGTDDGTDAAWAELHNIFSIVAADDSAAAVGPSPTPSTSASPAFAQPSRWWPLHTAMVNEGIFSRVEKLQRSVLIALDERFEGVMAAATKGTDTFISYAPKSVASYVTGGVILKCDERQPHADWEQIHAAFVN